MAVTIDIPGVGNVEAKNAASEATLQAILKAMQGVQKNTAGGGGGGSGGGGSSSGGTGGMNAASNAAHQFGKALGASAKNIIQFSNGVVGVIDRLANMGDSISGAAAVFDKIPIVGTVFAAVAKAVENTTAAYQGAAQSGATFGGSINAFAGAASSAGMTMKDFSSLVGKNGEALRLLGGNTETGGRRFADIAKTLRTTSKDLYALGYSTEDVNQGMANYAKTAMAGGRNANMTNAQLVSGTQRYLKEMDLLAKVTGETRQEQEDQRKKLLADAQAQAAMTGMSDEVRESFLATVGGMQGPLKDVAKDIIATGSATTKESQDFMAMMPNAAKMMVEFAQKTQRGEAISQEERNKLNNLLAEEGKASALQYRDIGRYSSEFAKQTNIANAAASIGKDALLDSAKAQDEATKKTDGQAAAMESMKQSLANISNTFQMTLANANTVLGSMMNMMSTLVDVVQKYVIPIFQEYLLPAVMFAATVITDILLPTFLWLADGLKQAGMVVLETLTPVFNFLGQVIQEYVLPAFLGIRDFLNDHWMPVLLGVSMAIGAYLIPQFMAMIPVLITNMAQYIATGLAVASAFWPVTAVILGVVAAFIVIQKTMKHFGLDMDMLGDGFSWIKSKLYEFGSNFKLLMYKLLDLIPGLDYGKEIEEAEADILVQKEENARIADGLEKKRQANLDATAKKEAERTQDRTELKQGDYKKAFNVPELKLGTPSGGPKLGSNADYKAAGAANSNFAGQAGAMTPGSSAVDFTNMSPEQVAAYAYKNQNGSPATNGNEASRREMENKAKVEAEIKEKAAEEAKKQTEGGVSKPQESAETLLASLNTKMEQLIVINRGLHALNDKQLTVQQGLGSDVFSSPA